MARLELRAGCVLLVAAASVLLASLGGAAVASAAVVTFGSPLSVAATHNTDELNYTGTTPAPGIKVNHDGADTALWNVALPGESPASPVAGEVVSAKLEGCAEESGGQAPLTEIHFQTLRKEADGSFHVEATSNPFHIPTCGSGASGTTVSTFQTTNFCVAAGEYIDFNDDGGFAEPNYFSGVPYRVIGSVPGASMDSFVAIDGAGNGATFSPSETNPVYGFASNSEDELMLQVDVQAAGSDLCPGSEKAPPVEKSPTGKGAPEKSKSAPPPKAKPSVLKLLKQSETVKQGKVSVSLSCVGKAACSGTLVLKAKAAGKGGVEEIGHKALSLAGGHKQVVTVALSTLGRKRMRAAEGGRVKANVTLRSASGVPSAVGMLLLK